MKKILFFLFSLNFIFSCEKPCIERYHFEFPVSLSPEQDTFQIGDTLFLELSYTPSLLENIDNGDLIDIKDYDFGFEALVSKFDSTSELDALDYFTFGSSIGQLSRNYLVGISVLELKPEQVTEKRVLDFYLIPQQKGNFHFSFLSLNEDHTNDSELLGSKCDEILTVDFNLNDKADNNFDYYNSNSINEKGTLESSLKSGFYAFVVIE